ncbi:hypothetical protein [Aureispira sp. CCB-QB1]|uniref:hypothetical protein n=1 Tax=Aureispira sp. CCB-QB1 TaxID=1313421 RepID=UPI0012DF980B|nr:hypothetical protein [Aureispira sp. CCB-QB1]
MFNHIPRNKLQPIEIMDLKGSFLRIRPHYSDKVIAQNPSEESSILLYTID